MTRDEVKEFKNDLRSYQLKKNRLVTLKIKREQIYYRLTGMGAKPIESNGIHSDQNSKEMSRLNKYKQIDDIDREIELLEKTIANVDEHLEMMHKGLRKIAIEVYCNGKSLDSYAESVSYSTSGLAKRLNKEFERVMKK